jgi:hypothetical protein
VIVALLTDLPLIMTLSTPSAGTTDAKEIWHNVVPRPAPTKLSPTSSLASSPSLCHHPTTHWPHCGTPTANVEYVWRHISPYGSRSNKLPALPSPSTATRLPESLDRPFPIPYASNCSRPITISRTLAQEQR